MIYVDQHNQPIPLGQCVIPDNYQLEFKVVIRSCSPISADRLKNLIQTKFEVLECERNEDISICISRQ